jgi:hypothetical protein
MEEIRELLGTMKCQLSDIVSLLKDNLDPIERYVQGMSACFPEVVSTLSTIDIDTNGAITERAPEPEGSRERPRWINLSDRFPKPGEVFVVRSKYGIWRHIGVAVTDLTWYRFNGWSEIHETRLHHEGAEKYMVIGKLTQMKEED